jgi:response regulator RpfG family c-di-GMP phosphodiesterase
MHRLLLVDDEPNVLSALRRALRTSFGENELRIETIDNPGRALARAGEVAFDLVVSDFRMPGLDGVQFLQQLRRIQPQAVRFMLSASAEVDTLLRALNEGEVLRFIVKPWNDEVLVAQIREGLARADELREEQRLADQMRQQRGELSASEVEARRLAAENPALVQVDWGPNGEILMPDGLLDPDNGKP